MLLPCAWPQQQELSHPSRSLPQLCLVLNRLLMLLSSPSPTHTSTMCAVSHGPGAQCASLFAAPALLHKLALPVNGHPSTAASQQRFVLLLQTLLVEGVQTDRRSFLAHNSLLI